MQLASDQDNEDVINTDLPYGETYKIGKKEKKTRQIDLLLTIRIKISLIHMRLNEVVVIMIVKNKKK